MMGIFQLQLIQKISTLNFRMSIANYNIVVNTDFINIDYRIRHLNSKILISGPVSIINYDISVIDFKISIYQF